ncbi:MAG: hypothetical protein COA57_00145 [Flavobacteriales bacterium]|nr:MAG: hypothetical protein COA57_00145 [Flavobacteriales bacterium]
MPKRTDISKKTPSELIIETLKDKPMMKQVVYRNTVETFDDVQEMLKKTVDRLKQQTEKFDEPISINYRSKGEWEAEIKIAGDILIFHMHTNVFQFDKSHPMWKTSYVKKDNNRAFCGLINVYNFLSDSFKYNRESDMGYLIARIFINKDKHFFVEGKRQLGFLYNDFPNAKITKKAIESIIESTILYTLDFDLLTPSYDAMKEVSVKEMQELTQNMKFRTGKRLGFKFQADSDNIE